MFVDEYEIEAVERALRSLTLTPTAQRILVAHATAENRAMSRWELTQAIGGRNENSVNSAYGNFAKKLALLVDPSLEARYRPESGKDGDYIMFLNFGPPRWTKPLAGEQSTWVFVMRENLARALSNVGIAPYTPLADFLTIEVDDAADSEENFFDDRDDVEDIDDAPSNPLFDIDDAADELDVLSETERDAVVLARIGQGRFREDLLTYWEGKCAVTGVPIAPALVASHIKPWRFSDNAERLDVFNGLLLVGTLDRLFDVGLIAFSDTGALLVHDSINVAARATLGLSRPMRLRSVHAKHRPFLRKHREMHDMLE